MCFLSFYKNNNNNNLNNKLNIFFLDNDLLLDYYNFINNDSLYNRVIYYINNFYSNIYYSLFYKYQFSPNIFTIYYNNNNSFSSNNFNIIDDLYNPDYRFIFIRLIICNKFINHLNGILIDKTNKFIYILEPKLSFSYNLESLKHFLGLGREYLYFTLSSIGIVKPIQTNNLLCQSYVLLLVYLIIVKNSFPFQYKSLFDCITPHDISIFIFYIYNTLSFDINFDVPFLYSHHNNFFKKIFRLFSFKFFNSNSFSLFSNSNKSFSIVQHDDYIEIL